MKTKTLKSTFMLASIMGISVLFLSACGSSEVKEGVNVDISYMAIEPETNMVVASGSKSLDLNFSGSQIFTLLRGAKKGETRSDILQDPLNIHNPEGVYKQTAMVFEEMGVPAEIGQEIEIGGKKARVTDIISENGIEQIVLDTNKKETTDPLMWSFTINEIK